MSKNGFGLSDLRSEAAGTTKKKRTETIDVRLQHPHEEKILEALRAIADGSENDVAGAAKRIEEILTSDGVYLRVAANRKVQNDAGDWVDEPMKDDDGKRKANFGSFSIWAAKPVDTDEDADANRGKMLYRSWAQGKGRKGFVKRVEDFVNSLLQAMVGAKKPASNAVPQIPEGHAPAEPAAAMAGKEAQLDDEA